MNRPQQHFVKMGPSVPIVPITHFTTFAKSGVTHEMFDRAWEICGPTAAMNLRKCELWEVITAAYLEGVAHGSGLVLEQQFKPEPEPYT